MNRPPNSSACIRAVRIWMPANVFFLPIRKNSSNLWLPNWLRQCKKKPPDLRLLNRSVLYGTKVCSVHSRVFAKLLPSTLLPRRMRIAEQLHTPCIRAHLYFCVIGKTFVHQHDKIFPMTQKKSALQNADNKNKARAYNTHASENIFSFASIICIRF